MLDARMVAARIHGLSLSRHVASLSTVPLTWSHGILMRLTLAQRIARSAPVDESDSPSSDIANPQVDEAHKTAKARVISLCLWWNYSDLENAPLLWS